MSGTTPARVPSRALSLTVVVLAALAQLVVLVPFTIGSGLVAPLWAVVLLHLVWVAAAAAFVALMRTGRALWTPLVPIVNLGVLALAITAGERLLGWTA